MRKHILFWMNACGLVLSLMMVLTISPWILLLSFYLVMNSIYFYGMVAN